MADRKTSADKPSGFYRVEATAHLTSELTKEFDLSYPLANKSNGELLGKIKKGEVPFFSFNVNDQDKAFLNEIIITALSRATNPEDYSFSVHGDSGHSTYKEALETVIKFIQAERADMQKTFKLIEVDTNEGRIEIPVNRFTLTTQIYERETKRPFAHDWAIRIKRDTRFGKEDTRSKLLRNATLENGVGFGILMGFYAGESINGTLDLFADPNFKRNITDKFKPKPKIPSRSRGQDIKMLADIAAKLTVPTSSGRKPSFSPENYLDALNILIEQGYLNTEQTKLHPYDFIPAKDTAQAIVVLKGGNEAAQKIAPSEFVLPERIDYIDRKYGNISTSEIITAYLIIN